MESSCTVFDDFCRLRKNIELPAIVSVSDGRVSRVDVVTQWRRHGIVSMVVGGGVKNGGCHTTFKGDKEKL